MKRILSLTLSLFFILLTLSTASAAEGFFVFDNADYFTEESISEIDTKLSAFSTDTDHEIYLLTKYGEGSQQNSNEYAHNFIEVNGLGLDGTTGFVVFLDLDSEIHALYDFGEGCDEIFTDNFTTALNYSLTVSYSQNDYESAFIDAVENTYSFLEFGTYSFLYSVETQAETAPVSAVDKKYVSDDANVLSDEQEAELTKLTSRILFYHDIDAAVHISNGISGMTVEEYANKYYEENGFAYNCILLVFDPILREYYILTNGYPTIAFYDSNLDSLVSSVTEYLSKNEYYEASDVFLQNVYGYLEAIHNDNEFNYSFSQPSKTMTSVILKREVILIIVSLVVAGVVIFILQSKMNTARQKTQANDYLVDGSLNITASGDYFISKNVVRVPKQSNNSSGRSSSSSRGGRGGKF